MRDCEPIETEESKAIEREGLIRECKEFIAKCEYMIRVLEIDPDRYAVTIGTMRISIGTVDGSALLTVKLLYYQIEEAQKCIEGKPNKYE